MNDNSPDATSILGAALGSPDQPAPQTAPVGTGGALTQAGPAAATVAPQPAPQQAAQDGWSDMNEAAAAQPTSRLHSILAAVAGAVGNGLAAGAGQRGRQSFGSGVQAGAQKQLEYEFQSAADAARARDFTLQEKQLQNQTQEYQDKHDAFMTQLADYNKANGVQYTYVPNDDGGQSVLAHFKGQMVQQGNIQVPAGTIPMSHGWLVPQNDADIDANTQNYNSFAPFFGLTPVKGKVTDASTTVLNNLLAGRTIDGRLMSPEQLDQQVGNLKYQLDQFNKNPNADKQVAGVIQGALSHMQALRTEVQNGKTADTAAQTKTRLDLENQNKIAQQNSPQGKLDTQLKQLQVSKLQQEISDKKNAANNSDWRPKVTSDEKKKAELGENVASNANEVAQILLRRPDLVGPAAGRYTNVQQMIGNNDPDISALGTHIHNIAMANSGIHGFRSQEGVENYERQLLNNFRNGPRAIGSALKASTDSVQTFIDNARPDTYKTHSKQGGAVRGMMVNQ